jgi:hypothetical protein
MMMRIKAFLSVGSSKRALERSVVANPEPRDGIAIDKPYRAKIARDPNGP